MSGPTSIEGLWRDDDLDIPDKEIIRLPLGLFVSLVLDFDVSVSLVRFDGCSSTGVSTLSLVLAFLVSFDSGSLFLTGDEMAVATGAATPRRRLRLS